VIGDALLELGRYGQARHAFRRMLELKPTSSAYARWSYALELVGDRAGAVKWMRRAQEAAVGQREPYAWVSVQLGNLHWGAGRVGAAAREYRLALTVLPGYVYALDALARAAAAADDLSTALRLQRRAVEMIPLPQFVSQLGDLYRAARRSRAAREQYATVAAIARLQRANGVSTDLESALFAADHGEGSVALARRAHAARPSVDGEDTLAWTLARSGRCEEARSWSLRALRLGTKDALKLFHRAWIEHCLGHRSESRIWARRALRLNPHFSLLWSVTARRLAR
jgi:tetratricopeptide (TPR) repeat protein